MLSQFNKVWLVDFEFSAPPGERPRVLCLVAREYRTGQTIKLWEDDLRSMDRPPFSIDTTSLYVAYYASAEMSCHLALGWPLPKNLLDLFAEFRNNRNGLQVPCGFGLLGALAFYGLGGIGGLEKEEMRELAIRGGPFTETEKTALLDYCETDVIALAKLLPTMVPEINLKLALLRGRFMKAAASIEHVGVPVDTDQLTLFRNNWDGIKDELIRRIDSQYGVYEGQTFKRDKFKAWLTSKDIPWPTLISGEIDLTDDTFKTMSKIHTEVAPLRELRQALSGMRLSKLTVGQDGRNRCLLSAFRAKTGRNQPSNNQFIFGPSAWLRGLIRPEMDSGLAYIDWGQQEFGIAAALSRDPMMLQAYQSGDPYLAFAKQAGAVPLDGTKQSHPNERTLFKSCVLAVQYGMGAESLAKRVGQPVIVARELLQLHQKTYKIFWEWSDACLDFAMLHGKLWTVFGWKIHIDAKPNPRSLRNFLMQANGAEMLRLACCLSIEAGIRVCAPVHDALLIEAPLSALEEVVTQTQRTMEEASAIILNGFKLRSDANIIRYPNRYMTPRGQQMWDTVQEVLKHQRQHQQSTEGLH
jgi:DNA polymerase-1